jgi:hypothetical protein
MFYQHLQKVLQFLTLYTRAAMMSVCPGPEVSQWNNDMPIDVYAMSVFAGGITPRVIGQAICGNILYSETNFV